MHRHLGVATGACQPPSQNTCRSPRKNLIIGEQCLCQHHVACVWLQMAPSRGKNHRQPWCMRSSQRDEFSKSMTMVIFYTVMIIYCSGFCDFLVFANTQSTCLRLMLAVRYDLCFPQSNNTSKGSQMSTEYRVLFQLISESLSVKLHFFFPRKFTFCVSLGIPFLNALVFSNWFGFFIIIVVD